MFQAQGSNVKYGANICAPYLNSLGEYILITHKEPWELIKKYVTNQPNIILEAKELSKKYLDDLANDVPGMHVVGLGGGSAMDTAKWVHWRRQLPLTLIPSIPSVDACFTRMSALREQGGVIYDGDAVPDLVLVDFDLFRAAPKSMVTSGIGDVLSCQTAWFDWKLAHEAGKDEFGWTKEMPKISQMYLDELYLCAPGIAELTDDGLRRLMELHRDIGWRCHDMGHARFEEGSEHFFAYTFEEVTGRTILHGELVSMGVLIMSYLQGNDFQRAKETISLAKTRHRLDDLGVKREEVLESLRRLQSYTVEQKHWYSQARFVDPEKIDEEEIIGLLNW
jgi:glycerol dehydrogenase-like iron-containing ADH family enzyme